MRMHKVVNITGTPKKKISSRISIAVFIVFMVTRFLLFRVVKLTPLDSLKIVDFS